MEGTNGKSRGSDTIEPIYYIKDNKVQRRNEYKGTRELESLMGIVASKVHYSRSDMLSMYIHEFYALVNSLSEKSN